MGAATDLSLTHIKWSWSVLPLRMLVRSIQSHLLKQHAAFGCAVGESLRALTRGRWPDDPGAPPALKDPLGRDTGQPSTATGPNPIAQVCPTPEGGFYIIKWLERNIKTSEVEWYVVTCDYMKIKYLCPQIKLKGAPVMSRDDILSASASPPHLQSRTGWGDGATTNTQNLSPGIKGAEGSGKVGRKNVLEATLTPKTEPAQPGQSVVFWRGGRAGREEERTVSHHLVPAGRGREPTPEVLGTLCNAGVISSPKHQRALSFPPRVSEEIAPGCQSRWRYIVETHERGYACYGLPASHSAPLTTR